MTQSENLDRAASIAGSKSCLNFRSELWVSSSKRYLSLHSATVLHTFLRLVFESIEFTRNAETLHIRHLWTRFRVDCSHGFSKQLEKSTFFVTSTVSTEFHKNIEKRGSGQSFFGRRCHGLFTSCWHMASTALGKHDLASNLWQKYVPSAHSKS